MHCLIIVVFFTMLFSEAKAELKDVWRIFQKASQPRGIFFAVLIPFFPFVVVSCVHYL